MDDSSEYEFSFGSIDQARMQEDYKSFLLSKVDLQYFLFVKARRIFVDKF